MLITRETDYALRILRALAPGSCLTVGEIAEKESLPHKFTYKIMKKLEKARALKKSDSKKRIGLFSLLVL